MIPGPNYLYKCPVCGNKVQKGSLLSGNTFGAKLYSDAKRVAPMLPVFPLISRCKNCDTIFWLDETSEDGTYEGHWQEYSDSAEPEYADFLSIHEYRTAIEQGLARNNTEQIYLRQNLWWLYNDRARENKEMFAVDGDESLYAENCKQLLSLLDPNNLNQKIMSAELNRNIGKFEACMEIINSIEQEGLNWLKDIFNRNCEANNRLVVVLDS